MAQAVDQAGNIWEVDAQGNPVRYVGKVGGGQRGLPSNPMKVRQAENDIAKTQVDTQGRAIDNEIAASTKAAQIAKAQADAAKAQADAATAQAEVAAKPDPARLRAVQSLQNDELLGNIDRARQNVSGWTAGLGSFLTGVPGTPARDLSGDLNTIASNVTLDRLKDLKTASPNGASGLGSLTEREGAMLRDSIASIDQGQSPDKVKQSLDAIELHYRRLRALQDGQNPDNPEVAKQYGIVVPGMTAPVVGSGPQGGGNGPSGGDMGGGLPQVPGSDGGAPMALSGGQNQTIADPLRRGINSRVEGMIRKGASADQIREYLRSVQIDPDTVGGIDQAVKYRKTFPAYKGPYNVNLETRDVPLGMIGSAINKNADSGFGSYALNAADALTAGTLDNMTANPAATRAAMGAITEGNGVIPALAGTMTGGALAASGLEALAGRAGLSAIPAAMTADAGYGAAYGAGSADDGNRLTGALTGAAIGTGGGMAGRGIANAAGGLVRGITDPSKLRLANARVPLTIGQMAGGGLKNFEDRLSGFPLTQGLINGQRKKGVQAFNRAAFDEALAPIGGSVNGMTGEQAVAAGQGVVSDAYNNALRGVQVRTDLPYKQGVNSITQVAQNIPGPTGEAVRSQMEALTTPFFGAGGTLTGNAMQDINQNLQGLKRTYRSGMTADPLYATHIAPTVDAYLGNLDNLLERQAPGVMDAYRAANAANSGLSTVSDAVIAARNAGGEFTPAQLMNASKTNTTRFSGKRTTATGGGGLFGLARAGNDVLPSKVPDPGTAGQLATLGLLGGAGGAYGLSDYAAQPDAKKDIGSSAQKALLAAFGLALAGKGARPVVQQVATLPRSTQVRSLGDYILANPQIGSGFATPLLLANNNR